jgi:hypothetical protein
MGLLAVREHESCGISRPLCVSAEINKAADHQHYATGTISHSRFPLATLCPRPRIYTGIMASFLTLVQHYTHGTRGQMPLAGVTSRALGSVSLAEARLHLLLDCRARKDQRKVLPRAGSRIPLMHHYRFLKAMFLYINVECRSYPERHKGGPRKILLAKSARI